MDGNGIPSGTEIGAALSGGAAFVEKLDQATGGWWAVHKAKQQVKAAEKKISLSKEALESIGIQPSDGEMRAIAFSALQEVKGFENLSVVVGKASIPEDAPAEDIENEWMSRFVKCSKEAFSEWKRVLLAECAEAKAIDSSSISMNALNAVARMEAADIEAFKALCSLAPYVDEKRLDPIVFYMDDTLLSLVGMSSRAVTRLCDVGVVSVQEKRVQKVPHNDGGPSFKFYAPGETQAYLVNREDNEIYIELSFGDMTWRYRPVSYWSRTYLGSNHKDYFDFGLCTFTEAGKELSSFFAPRMPQRFAEYVNASLKISERVARRESESFEWEVASERDFERAVKKAIKDIDHHDINFFRKLTR